MDSLRLSGFGDFCIDDLFPFIFSESFGFLPRIAATLTGGYRDIQLTVRLNSAESRNRQVHEHVAELQLHLAPLYNLKTGGGHQNYVMCRNLSGA